MNSQPATHDSTGEPMMKAGRYLTACVLTFASLAAFAASDMAALKDRVDSANSVIKEIMATPDKGIPDSIVKRATCIGVIPAVKKAAFVVGASYGQGVVTCRTAHGWSAPVFIRLAGGSFGLQIGAQSTDLVLVAVNQKGFQDLLKSKFKLGADAAAAAGPVGRNAAAGTDWKLNAELLTYSRSKGLFAGIDLNGAVVSQNTEDTTTFYEGKTVSFEKILHGSVPVPADARPFVTTIAHYFHTARTT
jgi:lipid-binding SYLF domain-containing protein